MRFFSTPAFLLLCFSSLAQTDFRGFKEVYPIGDDANIGYKTSYVASETILFEANPNVKYSFYNNLRATLLDPEKEYGWCAYIHFKPQLRMYTDNSLPVKMPSYRVFLGTQHLFKVREHDLFAISLESGHYSNGQSGSAFSADFKDGSKEGDSLYSLINADTDLSKILNRTSGNFSTNLTELIFNYRFNKLNENYIPYSTHSLKLGTVLYHDGFLGVLPFGGYSDNDIKLYGRWRFLCGYEYVHTFRKDDENKGIRLSLSENLEVIQGAHPSVNPVRSETTLTLFPTKKFPEFGFFVSYVGGHDNYNFRFVDSGSVFFAGITWTSFAGLADSRK